MRRNYPLVALGMVILVVATLAGLSRIGFSLPLPERLVLSHGALMIAGFFGTLISLERAYAMGKGWGYAVPLLTGIGGLATIAGWEHGFTLITLGSVGFVLLFIQILRFQLNLSTATLALGVFTLLAGNLLWYQQNQAAIPFWGAFLLLTIAGERIELAQLVSAPGGVRRSFALAVGIYLAGVFATLTSLVWGLRISGIGMLALFAWLLRYDVAMKSIVKQGLPKFIGIALVAGYLWLGVSGALALAYAGSFAYDIMLHALFLGFVFSMVFGHAPVIFPALLGREMRFLNSFYLHLALLHLSLLIRLAGSLGIGELISWGGFLSALAIFLFLINNARALRK